MFTWTSFFSLFSFVDGIKFLSPLGITHLRHGHPINFTIANFLFGFHKGRFINTSIACLYYTGREKGEMLGGGWVRADQVRPGQISR